MIENNSSNNLLENNISNNDNKLNSNETFTLSEANAFLDFWREFDLDGRRMSLDKTCLEMREMKTSSISGRKRLNELTKTFRSKSKDEQLLLMTDVLKGYQDEIDQLSRRSKYSEASFYGLYKSLYEAPDPAYAIESMINLVSSSSVHQIEIERLKLEIQQYEEEFTQLKNQDITIRRLEEIINEYKEKLEDKVIEEVAKKAKDIELEAENRINEIKDMQKLSEKRLVAALETTRLAQESLDRAQTQLYEVSNQAEIRISALQAENSILAEGAQRHSLYISQLENEINNLKSSTNQEKSNKKDEDNLQVQLLLVTELRNDLHRKEEVHRVEKQKLESIIRDITSQLSKEKEISEKFKLELVERPTREDYVSLGRQLKALQRVLLNIEDDDNSIEGQVPELTNPQIPFVDKLQFENLMASRIKMLENDLTQTRRELIESKDNERQAISTIASLQATLEANTILIKRLESDLESQVTNKRSNKINSKSNDDGSQGLAALLSEATSNNTNEGNNSKLVTILSAQRDRYKERLTTIESQLIKCQQQLDAALTTKGQLESDNVALYSKIRFLQSYGSIKSNKFSDNSNSNKRNRVKIMNDEEEGNEMEIRYESLYEQKINPFLEFSQYEKQRKINELSVADRIVLNTTMAFVSTHTGRSFLLVYIILMHLLVFITIYYSAHHIPTGCDPSIQIDPQFLLYQQQQQKQKQEVVNNAAATIAKALNGIRF